MWSTENAPPPLFMDIGKAKASSHGPPPPSPNKSVYGSVRVLADGKFAGHEDVWVGVYLCLCVFMFFSLW
jgi:hypothetical protein